jgi:hypothetical protein
LSWDYWKLILIIPPDQGAGIFGSKAIVNKGKMRPLCADFRHVPGFAHEFYATCNGKLQIGADVFDIQHPRNSQAVKCPVLRGGHSTNNEPSPLVSQRPNGGIEI